MVYLVYAAGSSAVYSVIADAWTRAWQARGRRSDWRHYSSALVVFSLGFGVAAIPVGLLAGLGVGDALLSAVAVTALVFRTGSRYYEARIGEWRLVIQGDVANLALAGASLALTLRLDWDPVTIVLAVWAVGSVAGLVVSKRMVWVSSRPLRRWCVLHRREIRSLLADSFLLDVGAVGTPYAVAPLLGLANFGVYRAVSNVATPVQLILNPLRPLLAGTSKPRLLSLRVLAPMALLLTMAGMACYVILMWIPSLPVRLGVLSDLSQVAIPASLFVPANGLSFYLYLVARTYADPRRLFQARMTQTALAILCPVMSALGGGLQGAVWGFSGSALSFPLLWWWATRTTREVRSP